MKSMCKKCKHPIHTERIPVGKSVNTEWLHDNYATAWKVVNGIAQNLHFAQPTNIAD